MAAFQQRRRDTGLAPIYSVPSQDNLAAQATLSDDAEVLLFGPPSPPQSSSSVLADSTWTILPAPYSRATRSISYTSSQSSASWQSRASADAATSLGSPASLNHSLLPSHNGTGVFAPSSSLVQSQALPSVYASAVDFDSASETGDSASDLPSGASARLRRPSLAPSDHSNLSFDSDFSSSSSINASWALTEAALSTVPSARRRGRHALPGTDVLGTSQVLPQEDEVQDEDDKSSAGFTSDSSVEEEHVADEGASAARRTGRRKSRRGRRWATTAQASPAQRAAEQDEVDLALSHAAMSAGIVSSRRRAGPRPARPQPSPAVESSSSAIRSLSPFRYVESARSRRSVDSSGQRYKRRHRQAGRAGSSQKRSSTSASAGLSFASMEAERQRAQRMKKLVFERAQEEQIRTAQKSVLFGSLASKVMAIDPSTFPLLASAPTESAYPTPTPSRSTSPRPGGSRFPSARSAEVFARQARSELSLSGFDLLGETRQSTTFEDDDEGALTETEMDQPSTVWHRSASPPALAPRHYPSPAPISPPVRSLSSPSLPAYFHLSPLVSPSNSALDIVLDELPTRPLARRRSSSYISSPSAALLDLAVSAPLPSSPAARSNPSDLSHLSHEERILLSPSSPSSSVAGSAWGGDLDSFELAMSYWRRFLRKLKGGTAHSAGIDEPEGMGRREEEATTPLVERVLVPAMIIKLKQQSRERKELHERQKLYYVVNGNWGLNSSHLDGQFGDWRDLLVNLTIQLVDFYRRLWQDELSGTITIRHRIEGRYGAALHPQHNRPLSLREIARIQGVPATYHLLAYDGGPPTSVQAYVAAVQFFLERLADANIDSARGFKVVGKGVAVHTASAIGREWFSMLNPIISTVSGHLDDGQSASDYLKDQLPSRARSASPSILELSLEEEELDVVEEAPHSEVEADLGVEEKSLEAEEDEEEDEIHILEQRIVEVVALSDALSGLAE
ncbi:hypothetical protein JCM21900_001944 [Sporobolomyces salmonicolor]